ncbi:gamma-secretase-activating protein-like [Asterias amurensis]|uniref:gamma-secretase-activating protein-like n=1 Tax=Asterias amurensis TaxID=7602 RepID=UPI003AB72EC5
MASLCNFSCCFDINKDILCFVKSLRDKLPINTSAAGDEKKPELTVRIVGQERSDEVLYVWDDVSPFSREAVTHVGLYDPAKQKNSVLFVHESKLNIISCTMNQECSIIAYVTLEGLSTHAETTTESSPQASFGKSRVSPFCLYRAFLAEIQPQNRIFDLNVERRNLLRVQFLWGRQPKDRDAASRESRLLFLLHKESIGLYSLSLARMGNKGVMMSAPPDTQQVLGKFIWAQWDVSNQQLYVLLMRSRQGEDKPAPILRCLEFNSKTTLFTKILELTLPFPIKYSVGKEQYSHVAPSRTMSESSFNMEVIVQPGGSFCVCYQHPTKPKLQQSTKHSTQDKATPHTPDLSPISESDSHKHKNRRTTLPDLETDLVSDVNRRRAVSDLSSTPSPQSTWYRDLSPDASSPGSSFESLNYPSLSFDSLSSTPPGTLKSPPSPLFTPFRWGDRQLSTPSPTAEKLDTVDLNYSVLTLHHMTVLHCSVPQIPRELAETTKLYFTPLESYILVYSPGNLLHLLNVSPEVVPCLHVAFHGASVPTSPVMEDDDASLCDTQHGCQTLTHLNRVKTASSSGDCIFNTETGKMFRVSINKEAIPKLLVQDVCHSNKLALIHLVTLHLRDSVLIQKVINVLCEDSTNLNLSELLAEHLMGATFSAIRRQFDRDILRLLQFTNTDTSRGQLAETSDGERLASFRHCSYNIKPNVFVHKKDWMERRLSMEVSSTNMWETLEQRIRSFCPPPDPFLFTKPPQRFHPSFIEREIRKQRAQSLNESNLARQNQTHRTSFLKKVAASARRAITPSKKAVITIQPEKDNSLVLMEEDTPLTDNTQDTILAMTAEKLLAHLERYSSQSVSRDRLVNIAQEYVTCQLQQAKQLVLLLLHSCGYQDARTIPRSNVTLKEPSSQAYQLFRLIERFFMAVQSVCFPVPPGFQTYFTIQGLRCLDPSMFLQYVDYGVLRLTEEFVSRLMHEVSDDDQDMVNMKIEIVSRLPKGGFMQALQRWNHPISKQYLAQLYVADTLKEDGSKTTDYRNRPFRSGSQISNNSGSLDPQPGVASTFPPLSTLLRLLENRDPKVGSTTRSRDSEHHVDTRFVEKVALLHTVDKYGPDLSAVSF